MGKWHLQPAANQLTQKNHLSSAKHTELTFRPDAP